MPEIKIDSRRIIIGGPAYRMECDVRHAQSIACLGLRFYMTDAAAEIAYNHQHGCPVEVPRNRLFKAALEAEPFTHLIWLDSDCYFDAAHADGFLWIVDQLSTQGLPFCAIPVEQRNGACNIVPRREESSWPRLQRLKMEAKMYPCEAAGMAAVVFWLPWYRKHWPDGPWFRTDWERGDMISEDFWHTWQLTLKARELGGWGPRYASVARIIHGVRGVDPRER